MKKTITTCLMLLCLLLALALPALAAGGSGNGTGGGQGSPLVLESSSVADGAADVASNAELKLTFSKNVVNMTVKDSNLKCFSLTGPNGAVPVDVLIGDDQVDPNVKQIITLRPKSPLSPGTPYTLTISKALASKSGETLAADVTLRFKTTDAVGTATNPPSPSASAAVSAAASASAASAITATVSASAAAGASPSPSVSAAAPSAAAASAEPTAAPGLGIILWLICGGLTVVLVFALFIVKAIKKRSEPKE